MSKPLTIRRELIAQFEMARDESRLRELMIQAIRESRNPEAMRNLLNSFCLFFGKSIDDVGR